MNIAIPNKLIEASYQLSSVGMDLENIILYKLNFHDYYLSLIGRDVEITITKSEWSELTNTVNPTSSMKKAIEDLSNCNFKFKDNDEPCFMISSGEYEKGKITLKVNADFLRNCFNR